MCLHTCNIHANDLLGPGLINAHLSISRYGNKAQVINDYWNVILLQIYGNRSHDMDYSW